MLKFVLTLSLLVLSNSVISKTPVDFLTEVAYYEARGETFQGQLAVMQVVMNRVKSRRFPNTIEKVIHQRRNGVSQFSYWMPSDGTLKVTDTIAWGNCKSLAVRLLEGFIEVEGVGRSDHYYNPQLANPKWASKMKHKVTLGNHKFLEEGPRR